MGFNSGFKGLIWSWFWRLHSAKRNEKSKCKKIPAVTLFFYQAANRLSQHSDKHIIYLATTRYLRNKLMPEITYLYFIFVPSFLYSYRLIREWNVCKRLGTMVINKPLLTLQPEVSLPSHNCVTDKLDCSTGCAGRAVSENYRRAKGLPRTKTIFHI